MALHQFVRRRGARRCGPNAHRRVLAVAANAFLEGLELLILNGEAEFAAVGKCGQADRLGVHRQEQQAFVALTLALGALRLELRARAERLVTCLLQAHDQRLLILSGEPAGVGDRRGRIGGDATRSQLQHLQCRVLRERRAITEARLALGHAATRASAWRFSRHSRNTSMISASMRPLTSLAASSARLRTLRPLPRGSSS